MSFPYYDVVLVLVYRIFGNGTPYAGGRVHACVPTEYGAGIENTVAANLNKVAEHCADLLALRLNTLLPVLYDDECLVAFDVRGNGAPPDSIESCDDYRSLT